jgi:malonate-semialdehyde dehydrogenase (acetylating)/methylmalonate-semialdehyde dehydrogenase
MSGPTRNPDQPEITVHERPPEFAERTMQNIGHFSDGSPIAGSGAHFSEVFNPATGAVEARVSLASERELELAVAAARRAQPLWAAWNPQRRARVLIRFVDLINRNMDDLAERLSREHGKTLEDSKGDILRGLEVVEFAIGLPHLMKGEFSHGVGPAMDMYSLRQPLGIGAGITPFNFTAMIPMWMFAPAIAAGNAFILKPSERDPSVPLRLAELLSEAGLPAGVLNVINGDRRIVDAILAHPNIAGVSFVGSTPVAAHVYATAARYGKRVQSFGGAKNHAIVMPDADLEKVADALIGAGFGSAGERCMAISVAVPVGAATAERLIKVLSARVQKLNIGPYTDHDSDFGPVVTAAARERILGLVDRGIEEGATLVVDGRGFRRQGCENGFFLGPCLFDHVMSHMDIYRTEIFGPVLSVLRCATYEEALRLASDHEYGNGVAIFTRDGDVARDFASRVQVGMIGINVPIPTPLAYHSFGGWKRSVFGDLNQHGTDSFRFWTRTKTVTTRWSSGLRSGAEFSMPVLAEG